MSTPTTESKAPPRAGLTLLAVCVAVLIVPLGLSGSPVALPAIGQDLNASVVPLQWVVTVAGLAVGPSMSGLRVSSLGWRSIFVMQAALALVSLVGFVLVRESRNPNAQKVDWPGTTTFTAGLFLFTLGIVEGQAGGER